jgi:hypothetical protein
MSELTDKIDLVSIINMAAEHAQRCQEDIKLASTRLEHIRVTARANEAVHLLQSLERLFEDGTQEEAQPETH